jgi:transposase
MSAVTVIAETNGFTLFENSKQLVSYAGYDVVENQSGKRVGKTSISKKGNYRIRRIIAPETLSHVGA